MKKRERKGPSVVRGLIIIAALAGIGISVWNLLLPWMDRWESDRDYKKLEAGYVTVTEPEEEKEDKKDWWSDDVKVDFEELRKENPDIIGWIRFDNPGELDISYPVLYSGDNETYLRRDIYGNAHTAGCIFLEGLNDPDFSDQYNIIYGHNMKDGSMFGSLKKYKDAEFYERNPYFTLYTEGMAYRYQIFACQEAVSGGPVYQVGYEPNDAYQSFLDGLIEASVIDTGIRPDRTDQTLTLSTCTGNGYSRRLAVHAVLVDQQTTEEGKLN